MPTNKPLSDKEIIKTAQAEHSKDAYTSKIGTHEKAYPFDSGEVCSTCLDWMLKQARHSTLQAVRERLEKLSVAAKGYRGIYALSASEFKEEALASLDEMEASSKEASARTNKE